jgi:hypothetical protein
MQKPTWWLGNKVYLKHGDCSGIIVGITYMPGCLMYSVSWHDATQGTHYEMELSSQKEIVYKDA